MKSDLPTDVTYGALSGGGLPRQRGFAQERKTSERGEDELSDLLQALKEEERAADDYLMSEVSAAQIDALRRYYGEKYGDEQEGRSQVVTREVFETIEWLKPVLRRVFTSGGRIVEFEAQRPEDDYYTDAAADYVNYCFFTDNDGAQIIKDFIFDGLLQRIGFIAAEWKDAEYSAPEEISGLNSMQAQQLLQDRWTQIVEQDVGESIPDEAHPDGLYFSFKIKRKKTEAYAEVFCIAPEDMRISARAVSLETARYAGDIVRMMKGAAKRKWPDHAEAIDSYEGRESSWKSDDLRAERFRDLEGIDVTTRRGVDEAQEVEILREYIDFDLNDDGYPEKIRVYRIGDTILEQEEVAEHIYSSWCSQPIPHKLIGQGINDTAGELQRVKTVLTRGMLDSVYQCVAPRMGVDEDNVNLDDLLVVAPGVNVRVRGNPADKLMPIVVPDLSDSAIKAMTWIDGVLERRTGVTRFGRGNDPDILNKTATAAQLMDNAQGEREEEYADNLKVGLTCFFRKFYRLICRHQNEARAVKIAKEWRNVDPRSWNADLKCTVNTGLGTGAVMQQLTQLGILQADQVAAVQAWGPNPVVGPTQMLALISEKMRVMGYRDRTRFFGDPVNPDGTPWVPQPPPDPNTEKVKAQIQEGQARLQLDAQKTQQDAQLEQNKALADSMLTREKSAAELQAMRERAALELQLLREKNAAELELATEKATAEMQLKQAQMEFEAQLAERQQQFEMDLAEKRAAHDERMAEKKMAAMAKSNGSDANFGGQVG